MRSIAIYLCASVLLLAGAGAGRAAPLSGAPGWALEAVSSATEEANVYDEGAARFLLQPPDGRPAVEVSAAVAARLRSGSLEAETYYKDQVGAASGGNVRIGTESFAAPVQPADDIGSTLTRADVGHHEVVHVAPMRSAGGPERKPASLPGTAATRPVTQVLKAEPAADLRVGVARGLSQPDNGRLQALPAPAQRPPVPNPSGRNDDNSIGSPLAELPSGSPPRPGQAPPNPAGGAGTNAGLPSAEFPAGMPPRPPLPPGLANPAGTNSGEASAPASPPLTGTVLGMRYCASLDSEGCCKDGGFREEGDMACKNGSLKEFKRTSCGVIAYRCLAK